MATTRVFLSSPSISSPASFIHFRPIGGEWTSIPSTGVWGRWLLFLVPSTALEFCFCDGSKGNDGEWLTLGGVSGANFYSGACPFIVVEGDQLSGDPSFISAEWELANAQADASDGSVLSLSTQADAFGGSVLSLSTQAPPDDEMFQLQAYDEGSEMSVENAQTDTEEAGAGVAMLRFLHYSFPLASMLSVEDLKQQLGGGEGKPPINSYVFKKKLAPFFAEGHAAYQAATVMKPMVQGMYQGKGVNPISMRKEYTSPECREVQVDCLVGLQVAPNPQWTAAPASNLKYIAPQKGGKQVIPEASASSLHFPGLDVSSAPSTSSLTSAASLMFVVGEVYYPSNRKGGFQRSITKLLQLERILQVLLAREKRPVEECILGVVLMGPHVSDVLASALHTSLCAYQDNFPCLFKLLGLRRFLGFCTQDFFPVVASLHLSMDVSIIKEELAAVRASVRDIHIRLGAVEDRLGVVEDRLGALEGKVDALATRMDENFGQLKAQMDELRELLLARRG